MSFLLHFVSALSIAVLIIVFLRPHAEGLGLLDEPDQRKRHGEPVPMIGGIAVAFAVLATALLLGRDDHQLAAFMFAAMPMVVIGLLDDRLGLSAKQKLVVEVCVALVLVFGVKAVITDLGDLFGFGQVTLEWLAVPFTVVCIVGIINAHNMADGIDGLAGGMSLVSTLAFAFVAWSPDEAVEFSAAATLAGALCGFLVFNLPYGARPFRVFLGDAGSTFIGLALVLLAIQVTQHTHATLPPIAAVWILGLAIMDMGATMIMRIVAGRSPFAPDRRHLHHLLQELGVGPRLVVMIKVGLAALFALVGVAGWKLAVPEAWLTWGYVALALAYLKVVMGTWRRMQRRDA